MPHPRNKNQNQASVEESRPAAGTDALRQTIQPLLPLERRDRSTDGYDIFPSFAIAEGVIHSGHEALAERLSECNRVVIDRKSTRLNSSHVKISYAVFCLKKKKDITCRR